MMLLGIVLFLLATAGIAATAGAVLSDGYGPRPPRGDRFTDPRRLF